MIVFSSISAELFFMAVDAISLAQREKGPGLSSDDCGRTGELADGSQSGDFT